MANVEAGAGGAVGESNQSQSENENDNIQVNNSSTNLNEEILYNSNINVLSDSKNNDCNEMLNNYDCNSRVTIDFLNQ